MRIVIFSICRKATTNNGALSIDTAFTNLVIMQPPARLGGSIVTRLFFSAAEEGKFVGAMRLIDPDGQEVLKSAIHLDVPASDADGTGVYMDSVGQFEITIRKLGEYQFLIGKDGEEPSVFPFYVAQKGR
jgi:hypothetical protein